MKKCMVIFLVVATMILCLTGCGGKKATAVVTFENFESGHIKAVPRQSNCSAGLALNVLTVNVAKEGVYPLVISTNGTEYAFTLTYANGQFTAEADSGLTFSIK